MAYVPPHAREGYGGGYPQHQAQPPQPQPHHGGGGGGYQQQAHAGYGQAQGGGYGGHHAGYGAYQSAGANGYHQGGGGGGGGGGGYGGFGSQSQGQGAGHFGGFGHRSQPLGGYQSHYDPNPQAQQSFPRTGPAPAGSQPHVREDKTMDDLFKDHTPGINFENYENVEVSIKPNNVKPAESFEEMSLPRAVQDNIRLCGYKKPTPVQRYGIPVVVAGNDLMACAQTGSGKTAAYLIPAVTHAQTRGTQSGTGRTAFPTCLIMAPTRELTIQIYDEGRKFTYRTGLRCVVVYGGADPRQQIFQLQRGCDILAATPGRLWEMYQRGIVKFSSIKYLVLDEADRMLDMGFEPQIRTIVQGPETDMPAAGQRQTLMYSATFPREIQQLAREFLAREHYFLQVGRVGSTTENITQELRWVEDSDKRKALLELLAGNIDKLVLVFVERKRDADYLDRALNQMGVHCTSIHGDRMQREREEALGLFKAGYCKVLVATDVAARGLDIPNVALVVQFDLPSNLDDYVHRIGRTGRAGKSGTAIAFFNEKNKNVVNELAEYLQEHNQVCPEWLLGMVTRRPQPAARGRGRGGRGGRGGYFNRGAGGGYNGGGGNRFQQPPQGGSGFHHGGGGGFGHGGFQPSNQQNHHGQAYGTSHSNYHSRSSGGQY